MLSNKLTIESRTCGSQLLNDVKALCAAPNCPGLVTFLGAYHSPDNGAISIILEYMNGGSLADVVKKVRG